MCGIGLAGVFVSVICLYCVMIVNMYMCVCVCIAIGTKIQPSTPIQILPHSQLMEHPQSTEATPDLVPALHSAHRGYSPLCENSPDVLCGVSHLEARRILVAKLMDKIDLLQGHLNTLRARDCCRCVHRPELCADAALPEPRDVSVKDTPGNARDNKVCLVDRKVNIGKAHVKSIANSPRKV